MINCDNFLLIVIFFVLFVSLYYSSFIFITLTVFCACIFHDINLERFTFIEHGTNKVRKVLLKVRSVKLNHTSFNNIQVHIQKMFTRKSTSRQPDSNESLFSPISRNGTSSKTNIRHTSTPNASPLWNTKGSIFERTSSPKTNKHISFQNRYSLSDTSYIDSKSEDKSMKSVQTAAGPLLASSRYNIGKGLYADTQSPGLASRIVEYNKNALELADHKKHRLTHQTKYGTIGKFPVVNLNKSPLPTKPIRKSVTVRIAPPDDSAYIAAERTLLYNNSALFSPDKKSSQSEINTRSVLDALKEISRKRIHARDEDLERNKRQRKGIIHLLPEIESQTNLKRYRDDDVNNSTSASMTPSPKRYRKKEPYIDRLMSYSSSMPLYLINQNKTKRKADITPTSTSNGVMKQIKISTNLPTENNDLIEKTQSLNKPSQYSQTESSKAEVDNSAKSKNVPNVFKYSANIVESEDDIFSPFKPISKEAKQKRLICLLGSLNGDDVSKLKEQMYKESKKKTFDDVDTNSPKSLSTIISSPGSKGDNNIVFGLPNDNSMAKVLENKNIISDDSANTSTSGTTSKTVESVKTMFNIVSSEQSKSSTSNFTMSTAKTSVNLETNKPTLQFNFNTSTSKEQMSEEDKKKTFDSADASLSKLPSTVLPSVSVNNIESTRGMFESPNVNLTNSIAESVSEASKSNQASISSFITSTTVTTANLETSQPVLQFSLNNSTLRDQTYEDNENADAGSSKPLTGILSSPGKKIANSKKHVTFSLPFGNSVNLATQGTENMSVSNQINISNFITSTATSSANLAVSSPSFSFGSTPATSLSSTPTVTFGNLNSTESKLETKIAGGFKFDFEPVKKQETGTENPIEASLFGTSLVKSGPTLFGGINPKIGSPTPAAIITTSAPSFGTSGTLSTSTNLFGASNSTNMSTPKTETPNVFGVNLPKTSIPVFSSLTASKPETTSVDNKPSFGAPKIENTGFGNLPKLENMSAVNSTTTTNLQLFGNPDKTINTIPSFNTATTTTKSNAPIFGSPSTAYVFNLNTAKPADSVTNTNIFNTGETKTTPLFGSNVVKQENNLFNEKTTPKTEASSNFTFGNTNAPSGFGDTNKSTMFAAPFGTAAFTANVTTNPTVTTQSAPSFGGFGTTTTTTASNNSNIFSFGNTSANTSAVKPFGFGTNENNAFGSTSANNTFGSSTSASAFGSPNTTGNMFNAASPFNTQTKPEVAAVAPFGSTTNNIFNNNTEKPNAFGATSSTNNVFGSPAVTSSNVFASSNQPAQNTFGSAPNNNIFGSTNNQQNTTFGNPNTFSSSFGSTNQTSNVFGSTTQQNTSFDTTSSNTAGFGASQPSTFGTQNNAPSFGTLNQTSNTVGTFGNTSTAPGVFTFGSNSNVTPQNNKPTAFQFGASSTQTPASGGFNFSASSPPAFNANGSIPTFNAAVPQFNTPTGGNMFSIGSGSTAPRPRSAVRTRRPK